MTHIAVIVLCVLFIGAVVALAMYDEHKHK